MHFRQYKTQNQALLYKVLPCPIITRVIWRTLRDPLFRICLFSPYYSRVMF